jgi:uncharacterized membrane protein YjgN (DUF898 family)
MIRIFRFSRFSFTPRKPRHPLLRLVCGLAGVCLLGLLLVVGLFVGAAMLIGALLFRGLRRKPLESPAGDGSIVEGQYRVVRKPVVSLPR